MYTSKVVSRINEINKDDWNALLDDNVFISYEWLQTLEQTSLEKLFPLYVLIYYHSSLVGASACYIFHKSPHKSSLDNWFLGRLKKYLNFIGISFLPALICCPSRCYGSHFLVNKNIEPEKKKLVMEELLTLIEEKGHERNLSLGFPCMTENEGDLADLLYEKGYIKTVGYPLNYLDIDWSTFDDYKRHIKQLSRNTYKNINNEINKNKKEGVVIKRLEDIGGCGPRLLELLNSNYKKHNNISFPHKQKFFQNIINNFGKNSVIYIAIKKNEIIGTCVLLQNDSSAYISSIGVDHEMSGNDYTYFNIGYYKPISDAITGNIKRLYFGNAMYELKKRRGCKIIQTSIFYKPHNSLLNILVKSWFSVHSMWIKRKLPKNKSG